MVVVIQFDMQYFKQSPRNWLANIKITQPEKVIPSFLPARWELKVLVTQLIFSLGPSNKRKKDEFF